MYRSAVEGWSVAWTRLFCVACARGQRRREERRAEKGGEQTHEEGRGEAKIGVDLEDVGVAGRVEAVEVAREVALERVLRGVERRSEVSDEWLEERRGRHDAR